MSAPPMSAQRTFDALPEFARDPGSAMPSAAERRILSGSKRTFEASSADFGLAAMRTMLVDKPQSALPPVMRRALGAQLSARTTAIDTGSSTLQARGDTPVYGALMAKPPRTGWDDSYDETVLIWAARRESEHARRGYHAIANIPKLNYYARTSKVLKRPATMMRQDRRREIEREARLDGPYLFESAREFDATWSYLGPIASLPEGGYAGTGPLNRGSLQRLVPYVASGHARTRNIFSTSLREGDSLYVVVSQRPAPTGDLVAPDGSVLTPLSGGARGEPQVQVVGWSSSTGSAVPALTTRAGDPSDDDVDYVRRSVAMANAFRVKEWDDASGTFKVRNVAKDEGQQEALLQAEGESTLVDMYESGHVEPLGTVVAVDDSAACTSLDIAAAHWSGPAMLRLPVITYQASLY